MIEQAVDRGMARAASPRSHRLEAGVTQRAGAKRQAAATREENPFSTGCLVCDPVEAPPTKRRRGAGRAWRGVLIALILLAAPVPVRAQDPPKSTKQKAEDKQLAERLLRKTATGSDDGVMQAIIRLMNDAARRLEIEFDAGAETRAVQERITERLDEAIKIAASQRRLKRSRPGSGKSDKRRGEKGAASSANKQATGSDAPGTDAASSGTPGRVTGRSAAGELRETRRTWGHLPTRERDEILQGVQERFLETYREWIERYYRVLQEMDE